MLKGAAREVHGNDKVKFMYADVNCHLNVHSYYFFSSGDELKDIVSKL